MLVVFIKEGLTDFNYKKVAYVVTTDPSFLRMIPPFVGTGTVRERQIASLTIFDDREDSDEL
jgi:hypothetical protein